MRPARAPLPGCGLTPEQAAFLESARWGSLATAGADGRPHCVPVVFAWDGSAVLLPLDRKPKTVPVRRLRRVRNLEENPRAALMVHHWSEAWSELAWLMIEGRAEVGDADAAEVALLRRRYPPYENLAVEGMIRLEPQSVASWTASGGRL